MMVYKKAIFLLVTSLAFCFSNAQKDRSAGMVMPRLKVDNWQMDQGLPVNSIIDIAQTADGWLFFGTEEGLARFNGKTFLLMNKTNIPGLNVNFISALLGTADTSLWIGTEGDGLIRQHNGVYTKYNIASGLSSDRIYTLHEDSDGGIWIGTSGGGLNYLKNEKILKFDTLNGLASNYIRSIALDARGRVWVGTQKGLSVIDHGQIKNYYMKDGLSDDFIETLVAGKDQNIWIGTKSGGLNLFRNDRFYSYSIKDGLTSDAIMTLCFDSAGMLWIGTNGGGISRMKEGKFYPFTTHDGLSGDLIAKLFQDREGNIWAGSSGTGIDRIKKKSIQTLTTREGLPGDVILPVFEDHAGVLWMGIAGVGLIRWDNGKIQIFAPKNGMPDDLVLSIAQDPDHTLWIGTAGGGITSFKNGKFKTYTTEHGLSNNVVAALHCDRSGVMWAGTTGGGINCYKNGRFSALTTKNGLSHDNVTCITDDSRGNLWVGTNAGLNLIRNNKITVFTHDNGLSDDYILSLYEDKDGNVWAGTAANGFNLIRNEKITCFTMKDGLIHEVVLKIIEDDFGYFWISCNKGIYKVKKQDLFDFADSKIKSLSPVSFGKSDGLETTECNGGVSPAGFKTHNGKLLFPTMKGVAIVDPEMMNTINSYFSPIFIEEFLVDGQPVDMTTSISIPSYSKRLEFRFAALNYTNPDRIRYRCRLVGFDKDWIDCGTDRNAEYTNIPGGNYLFQVMASNENGQWNDLTCTELKFRLKPPFYRTVAFYLIIFIFLLLLLFFITYYFVGRYQRHRLKLLVADRTNELHQKVIAQELAQIELQRMNDELKLAKEQAESGDLLKTAFMNNISHEIRTPLNGILGFSQLMADPDLTHDERVQYLSIVKSSSNRLMNTITDYMDISLLASGNQEIEATLVDLRDLLDEIYNYFLKTCQIKKLSLTLQIPPLPGDIFITTDRELLNKVIRHLVDNAIKFTKQGEVTFGLDLKGNEPEFFVRDTGVGISREIQSDIFEKFIQENISDTRGHEGSGLGLSIVQGIIELMGGRIWFESIKGEGSSFYFNIPVEITCDLKTNDPEPAGAATNKPLVLIAEDEISGSILLETILEKVGVAMVFVSDGQQAVDACHQNPMISLVLMDLKMPEMDGFEATREIKTFRPGLPVIAITAYALSGDEKRALDAGCDDYIAKPFELEVLLEKLKKYISSQSN